MKNEQQWILQYPVSLNNVSPGLITKIQNNAYNQCLLDLKNNKELINNTDETILKYLKNEN